MIENRPTGDADAVGAINKVLRSLCPGWADEAGLTRRARVGRGKRRRRQARTSSGHGRRRWRLKSNARTVEGSSAGKVVLETGSSWRGATVLARSGGLIGIKAGPNNRSRIRCRRLH
jgi:hypothetical protein